MTLHREVNHSGTSPRAVLALPPSTYVDATLVPQSSAIKAVHIQQLRDGAR